MLLLTREGEFDIGHSSAGVVEFGRHARLRGVWLRPYGFESRPRHSEAIG